MVGRSNANNSSVSNSAMNSLSKFLTVAVVLIVTVGQFASFRWGVHDKLMKVESNVVSLESNYVSKNEHKNELDEVVAKLQSIISTSTKEITEQALRVENVVGKLDTSALSGHMEQLIKLLDERTGLQGEISSSERYTKDELYNLFMETVLKGMIRRVSLILCNSCLSLNRTDPS